MAEIGNLGNYSPEDVVMIIKNNKFSHQITGFADGTFINYERAVDRATLYVGADLSAGRVLRRNKSGTITLTLHKVGESNDILSELGRLDEEAHNNDWLFEVMIKDTLGRDIFYAKQAFLGNDPSVSYSTDMDTREWTITVCDVQRHIGGNSLLSPDNEKTLTEFGYVVEDKWKSN